MDSEQLEIDLLCAIIEHCESKIEVVEPIPLIYPPPWWDAFIERMGMQWRMGKMVREVNNLRSRNVLQKQKIASDRKAVDFCNMGSNVEDDVSFHMIGRKS